METKEKAGVLVKDKYLLTLNEASLYFGVGIHKLKDLTDDEQEGLAIFVGNRRMIKRKAMEQYLDKQFSI